MNPHEWKDAVERLQRHLEPNHQSAVNSSMGNTSASSNNWNTYCDYTARYAGVEPHGSNAGQMDPSPPSPIVYRKDSKLEEPDGEAVKMNEDEWLARKKQQLREIEERIIHKKASIALKTVGHLVNTTTADVSCKSETLRDRVNVILQQRCPLGFHSKVQSRKDRTNSSNLTKEGLLQEHPLKLRVKEVMKQRSSDDCILLADREEAPEVMLPSPSRSLTSPAKEEDSVNKGFERFLSILNKGVDINMLSRIVNDDRADLPLEEELLSIQSSDAEKKSDPVFRSESQQSNSRTNSSETKTGSLTERLSLPDAEEKNNDKGRHSLGSSSRSKSPPVVKKKKKEEEEKPKVDENQAHLQNILKTLGLSLEVEEMSKLADRTQERLYGKKIVDRQSTDSKEEQESQQRGSNRDSSPSSSSSSSSSSSRSSSRSTSRSFSQSPSPHQRQDGRHVSEETQDREQDGINSQQMSSYQHPYTQNQAFPFPHPSPPAFPGYSLLQYSHYTNNQSVAYSTAAHPLWSQPLVPYPNVSAPIVPVHITPYQHHRQRRLENHISCELPDLAESEGQGASASRPCFLQAVRTVQPSRQPCLKHIIGCPKKKRNKTQTPENRKKRKERKRLLRQEQALRELAQKAEASQGDKDDSKTQQSNEEKPQPTEQEIKANLRKRLNAFNQKAKHRSQLLQSTVMQPANSLTSENG
ncbi:zinc finger protein 318-like [Acanthochromis polyacanthus]|uniref:zinc finger protein 318-like n=1 Tax=Acanthochromis polyacanthus TaxID=80966 RepID=UPI0022341C02|nr:zinc finger protein 318-like [Acanthochromis polyacanthus]XP_022049041.2 zinc finger protein 318-like [Acanthochromis polyacanthus]